MSIFSKIVAIDSEFTADPLAVIDATGTTQDGQTVDLWIANDGTGPLVWPGASFIPYGGVIWNPVLISITAD